MAKPRKRVGIVQNAGRHDKEEVFDDDQVLNDEDDLLTTEDITTTGAIADFPGGGQTMPAMPGDRKPMDKLGGKGVAKHEQEHDNTGEQDTDTHEMGEAWPRHQKNTGGGVAEKMQGTHPGTLSASEDKMTPQQVADLLEDDGPQVQQLFDQYARQNNCICLAEFREYAAAFGADVPDEHMLTDLLSNNQEFMFTEHRDQQGRYWVSIAEEEECDEEEMHDDGEEKFCTKCYKKHSGPCAKAESRDTNGRTITEAPMAHPGEDEDLAIPIGGPQGGEDDNEIDLDEPGEGGGIDFDEFGGPPEGFDDNPELAIGGQDELGVDDFPGGLSGGTEIGGPGSPDMAGGDEFGMTGNQCPMCPGTMDSTGYCEECGYVDEGGMGGGGMGMGAGGDELVPDNAAGGPQEPAAHEGYEEFNHRPGEDVASHQLESRGRGQPILEEGQPHYKVYDDAPASHGGHEMEHLGGEGVAGRKAKKNSGLPQEKTDTHEMGKEWPRKHKNTGSAQEEFGTSSVGHPDDTFQTKRAELNLKTKQKNTGGQWEKFEGGGAGNMGGGAKQMYENVDRLATRAKEYLISCLEGAGVKPGKYSGLFVVHAEGIKPRQRTSLTEALVDAEELIQVFGPGAVTVEANYSDQDGTLVFKQALPLQRVARRGPVMTENKALFRFQQLASNYADLLVENGHTCSAKTHNWGAAVAARIPYDLATKAFRMLSLGAGPANS